MAQSKPIQAKEVIVSNVFKDTISSGAELLETLGDIEKGLMATLTASNEFIKNNKKTSFTVTTYEELTKKVTESKKAIEGISAVEKQRLKVLDNLAKASGDEAVALEKARLQLAGSKKETKELAKEQLNLTSEYQKQSKRLNDIRKQYKDLVLLNGRNTEGTKELIDEIQELDRALKEVDADVGQFQRNVGNYPQLVSAGTEQAKAGFADLGNTVGILLAGAFGDSRDEARTVSVTLGKLGNSVKVIGFALVSFGTEILLPFFENLGLRFEAFTLKAQIGFEELKNVFGGNGDAVKKLNDELKSINDQIAKNSKTIDDAGNPFDGLNNRIGESNDLLEKTLELQDRLIDTTSLRLRQIEELTTQEEKLQFIADDNTKSFVARENAIKASIGVRQERLAIERELANQQLDVAVLEVENDFKRRNASERFNEEQVKSLDFLEDKELADLISLDTLAKISEASLNLQNINNEAQLQEIEGEKIIAELKQDRLERDLDILIDGFDNQKTINERLIADERKTFLERQKIQDDTVRLADESFTAQKEVLANLSKAGIDVDELLTLDATELQKRIRSLEQSEIIEGRTLEVVRERRIVLQDLAESQRDLTDAQLESIKNQEEGQQTVEQDDFSLRVEKLEEIENKTIEIIDESTNIQKEALEDQAEFEKGLADQEIFDLTERASKKLEIEELLANDIERLEKDSAQRKKDLLESEKQDRIENAKEIASSIISETKSELDRIFDLRNEATQNQIDHQQSSIELQSRRAEEGQLNTLAFEEERLKEANLKKIEEQKKQQKIEQAIKLAEVYLEAYLNALGEEGANPVSAGAKALGATLLAKGIATGIASFYVGTEDTGTVSAPLDNNGGRLAVLHDNERVMTAKQNSMVGEISNDELSKLAFNYRQGTLIPEFNNVNVTNKSDTYLVVNKLESLEKAILGKPAPSYEFNQLGHFIKKEVDKGIHKTTIKRLS